MDIGVYSIDSLSDEKVNGLIEGRKSFVLEGIPLLKLGDTVSTLEKIIEKRG